MDFQGGGPDIKKNGGNTILLIRVSTAILRYVCIYSCMVRVCLYLLYHILDTNRNPFRGALLINKRIYLLLLEYGESSTKTNAQSLYVFEVI